VLERFGHERIDILLEGKIHPNPIDPLVLAGSAMCTPSFAACISPARRR
jgi:hypothetical protein